MKRSMGVVIVLVVAVAWCTSPAADGQATSRPATQPYPSKALVEACQKAAAELQKKLDAKFTLVTDAPFIVAGNMPADEVRSHLRNSVVQPAALMWRSYFRAKPDQPISILLLRDANSYTAWSVKLFGEDAGKLSPYGYYHPAERMMVMNIATGGGTLIHELTHALIVYDFPDKPDWFNEGLASLHEQCRFTETEIVGLPNWRLPALQKAIAAGKLGSLSDLVTTEAFYGPDRGIHYAQARYFCQFLQTRGLLAKFYAYYRDHHEGADAGIKAIEHICGKKIAQVDQEMVAWVKTLKFQ